MRLLTWRRFLDLLSVNARPAQITIPLAYSLEQNKPMSSYQNRRGRRYMRGGGRRNFGSSTGAGGDGDGDKGGEIDHARGYGPPPGLKGRDIGMWYAQRGRQRKRQQELIERPTVQMDMHRVEHIEKLLHDVQTEKDRKTRPQKSMSIIPPAEDDITFSYYGRSLEKNDRVDEDLKDALAEKKLRNQRYKKMMQFREKLPAFKKKQDLLDLIESSQVVVISGETGCGKTTQVAQFILDDYIEKGKGSMCRVVCTQPRRISAVSVAERVAEERGETVGSGMSVGYQIRLDCKLPRNQASILYCTTGILLKWLQGDPLLNGLSHVILDEVHEQNIICDFLIIILRDLLPLRPDMKLILMSATVNAEQFSSYYGNCPMETIPGFTFPVTEYWVEDVLEFTKYRPAPKPERFKKKHWRFIRGKRKREEELKMEQEYEANFNEYLQSIEGSYSPEVLEKIQNMDDEEIDYDLVVEVIRYIAINKEEGAILVFVPGWTDISKINDKLLRQTMFKSGPFIIIPLHSLMPTVNQRQIFQTPPAGTRKIIIATNIAETSITIEDVVHVVNTGKVKESNYDVKNNICTLKPEWISKAAAKQRRGRSGRVKPGFCYHLFTQLRAHMMADYQLPEMLRTPLEEVCLQIRLLKLGHIEEFLSKAMNPPPVQTIITAKYSLKQLNALDDEENLTPLGYHLAKLPVEPRIGKMILFAAMFCCLDPVLTIAASLSFKDPFIIPLGKEKEADAKRKLLSRNDQSDHMMLSYTFQGWEDAKQQGQRSQQNYCWDYFLSSNTLKMLDNMKTQFCEYLCNIGFVSNTQSKQAAANTNSDNVKLIKAVVCAGLYPNVAKIETQMSRKKAFSRGPRLSTQQDGRVNLHPKSVNCDQQLDGKWLIYHQKIRSNGIYLHDSSVIEPYPLLFFGGDITMGKDDTQDVIRVDDWIVFKASPTIATLVKKLRIELDELLESKITSPGITQWCHDNKEGKIMNAIVDLLTMEEDHDRQSTGFRGQSSTNYRGHSSHHKKWGGY
ncbi:ATP-dependent DNA/RNA helicase DHX36-like [Saccoglossus kowalevskii]|uniref:RNA helicase n=1 Tax=Saccoglossus kowalevskii TaxID=10224 RepID=A0ABM0GUF8_SACKO|nr:PREDICTED: probable ATP-dependent RNA helicase DHX36-like [Saccoglossus kowalevskii]